MKREFYFSTIPYPSKRISLGYFGEILCSILNDSLGNFSLMFFNNTSYNEYSSINLSFSSSIFIKCDLSLQIS